MRIRPEVSHQCVRGGAVVRQGLGNKEDGDNGDKVNGYKVNGVVLQWRVATRNGAALTLAGYNWEMGRGAVLG